MTFPPVHPILVNFTAGLIPAAFAFDLLATLFKKEPLRAAAHWTLLLAAVLTPFTALAGWLWMRSMDHPGHWQMPIHMWLGIALAALLLPLAAWRGWMYRRERSPGWSYAVAAAILLAGLTYQGELGASMSFGSGIVVSANWIHGDGHEHRTNGVAEPAPPGTQPTESPAQRPQAEHDHHSHKHGE